MKYILPIIFALTTTPTIPVQNQNITSKVQWHFEFNEVLTDGHIAPAADLTGDINTDLEVPLPQDLQKTWRCVRHAEISMDVNKLVALVCVDAVGNSAGLLVRCSEAEPRDEETKDIMIGNKQGTKRVMVQFVGECKLKYGKEINKGKN